MADITRGGVGRREEKKSTHTQGGARFSRQQRVEKHRPQRSHGVDGASVGQPVAVPEIARAPRCDQWRGCVALPRLDAQVSEREKMLVLQRYMYSWCTLWSISLDKSSDHFGVAFIRAMLYTFDF